jgi:flagellin
LRRRRRDGAPTRQLLHDAAEIAACRRQGLPTARSSAFASNPQGVERARALPPGKNGTRVAPPRGQPAALPERNRPASRTRNARGITIQKELVHMSTVNTNIGSLLSQKYLRFTLVEMNRTQQRVSSGLRVASALDDASTFAVASTFRADIKSYTAVASALSGAKASASVAISAGETISRRFEDVKAKIIQLADESISAASRTSYQTDLASMVAEVNQYLDQAAYQGSNLLGTVGGSANVNVVSNITASILTIRDNQVGNLSLGTITNAATASTALSSLATFKTALDTALANLGADVKQVDAQAEFIRQTQEAVTIGLGALVDADLAKESAQLESLSVKQQLGVQALGIANQAPQALLGLFR